MENADKKQEELSGRVKNIQDGMRSNGELFSALDRSFLGTSTGERFEPDNYQSASLIAWGDGNWSKFGKYNKH